jgi:high-affinity nickel permease
MFRLITKSWNMYFLGFLLSLDFDIAIEVGLLGISAASRTRLANLVDSRILCVIHGMHDSH